MEEILKDIDSLISDYTMQLKMLKSMIDKATDKAELEHIEGQKIMLETCQSTLKKLKKRYSPKQTNQ